MHGEEGRTKGGQEGRLKEGIGFQMIVHYIGEGLNVVEGKKNKHESYNSENFDSWQKSCVLEKRYAGELWGNFRHNAEDETEKVKSKCFCTKNVDEGKKGRKILPKKYDINRKSCNYREQWLGLDQKEWLYKIHRNISLVILCCAS